MIAATTSAVWPAYVSLGGVVAAIGLVFFIGNWKGKVDERVENIKGTTDDDRSAFRAFAEEIRGDIKKILLRLDPIAEGASPLSLNELGKKVSGEIGAGEWAVRVAPTLSDRVKGMAEYDIQGFCFNYVDDELKLSDEQRERVKQAAYSNGLDEDTVRRVLAFELRDRLLDLAGLDHAGEKKPPSPLERPWDEPQERRGGS